jgi:hypothetical protein
MAIHGFNLWLALGCKKIAQLWFYTDKRFYFPLMHFVISDPGLAIKAAWEEFSSFVEKKKKDAELKA